MRNGRWRPENPKLCPTQKKDRHRLSGGAQAAKRPGGVYLAFFACAVDHFTANACRSPKRLSKSAPAAVTT